VLRAVVTLVAVIKTIVHTESFLAIDWHTAVHIAVLVYLSKVEKQQCSDANHTLLIPNNHCYGHYIGQPVLVSTLS